MKTINIAELKAHLSRFLREVRNGEQFVILDRTNPVAELVPTRASSIVSPWERLASEGKAKLGSQDWTSLKISPLEKPVPIQEILSDVREDSL